MEPLRNPDHDYDDPANNDTFLRAYKDMTNYTLHPRCPHCTEIRHPLPMHGVAWGWESHHADRCPENVDNQQVEAVRVTEHFNGAEYTEAEAIWSASRADDQEAEE